MSRAKKRKKKLVVLSLIVLSCVASASIYHKMLDCTESQTSIEENNILPVPVAMKKTTYLKAVRMKINTTI